MSAANPFESYSGPGTPPDGCENVLLPDTTNPNCAADYNDYEGELCTAWLVPAEKDEDGNWVATAEPDNYLYVGDLDAIVGVKKLTIIGDKPLAEVVRVALAKRMSKVKTRRHLVNVDITDLSEENYEFIRTLQYHPILAGWFASVDGWHMGGNPGIVIQVDTSGVVWPRGEGSLMTGTVVFTWDNKFDPPAGLAQAGVSPVTARRPDELKTGKNRRKLGTAANVEAPTPLKPADVTGKATAEADNGETENEGAKDFKGTRNYQGPKP